MIFNKFRIQQASLTTLMIENAITTHMWIGMRAIRNGNTSTWVVSWVTGDRVWFTNFDSTIRISFFI
jgi:hypothetical protein